MLNNIKRVMEKIKTFFSKWGRTIVLCIWVALLLMVVACCIYTAIIRPIVSVPSSIASGILLLSTIYTLYKEIKKNL